MNAIDILFPLLVLVWWTVVILILIPYRRFKATFKGDVVIDDFKLGESSQVPEYVALANRNYMNLLELPVVFYVACVIIYVTETIDPMTLTVAWIYVFLRIIHSLIHVTYNKVSHRLAAFASSNLVLVIFLFGMTSGVVRLS